MQTNIWNVVFLVILGPIFEEWMFRKQLIDHTRKYGEKTAILLSGLAFGLFHMNLFQFFYAFLLGVMFGYIYMRTSKLRYSTAMHMIINFNGAVDSDARRPGPAGQGVSGRGKRQCGGDGTVGVAERHRAGDHARLFPAVRCHGSCRIRAADPQFP